MNILGIDFGLKKIGLALADTESQLAEPLETIKVKKQNKDFLIRRIKVICEKEEVTKIVLGLPESGLNNRIKEFGEELKKIIGLPIFYVEETLTSKEAIAKMIESGYKKKARREKEDQIAAALILQNYFDQDHA